MDVRPSVCVKEYEEDKSNLFLLSCDRAPNFSECCQVYLNSLPSAEDTSQLNLACSE